MRFLDNIYLNLWVFRHSLGCNIYKYYECYSMNNLDSTAITRTVLGNILWYVYATYRWIFKRNPMYIYYIPFCFLSKAYSVYSPT